ncbi:ABC-type glycerol-3-phosphate transport system, substrate-binding protein [Butyrivibrio sp. INlla18]|uniref:ABC transporter substrate-binding protein n=1 Tax=Butyrivibrio sp. INlla18 TaxID=1520806 RepID=UPI0008813023|nr:extracellular solute-binding protein [Butyrivibrio sp. INlla18]SDA68099.1 ABC-type glycerol-3-phosphate transport system, substrate-binding protein [Butyrivibrio sp. INlla18]
MKKRDIFKRITSVSLVLAMSVSLVTGCGKGKQDEESILGDATKASKDYVFASEDIIIDGLNPDRMNSLRIVGDRIYGTYYGDEGETVIYSFNSDGSDVKSFKIPAKNDESFSYIDFDSEGNFYAVKAKYNWFDGAGYTEASEDEEAGEEASSEASASTASEATSESASEEEDKEIVSSKDTVASDASTEASSGDTDPEAVDEDGDDGYAGEHYYDEEVDEEYTLVKYDNAGNEVYSIKLGEDVAEGDYYAAYGIAYSEEHGVILSSNQGIATYDEDKGFTTIIDLNSKYTGSNFEVTRGYNGDIFVTGYTDEGRIVGTLDFDAKDIGHKSEVFSNTNYYTFFGGNGYDIYCADDTAIYGYDLKSDKLVKLLDYIDSDLSITYNLNNAVAVSDTELVALVPDFDYNFTLTRLTKVPADQVKDRQIITLAGAYIDYNVRQAAVKFNKDNDEYKIKFVDYSTYDTEDDYDAGIKRFNLDIASGNVADIMAFDLESPVESYINKGLFLDVAPYFSSDPDIADAKYIDNIMDAFKTGDKMYQVVPYFEIATVACKASLVKGQDLLTMEDYKNIIEAKGIKKANAFGMNLRKDMLDYGVAFAGPDYIDWSNKTCSFNSDEFVELMEFMKDFPEEYQEDDYMDYDTAYRSDEALFNQTSLYGFDSFKRIRYVVFGEDVSFIGFPGSHYTSVIYPGTRLCISAQSKNADGAWKFIKYFLSEEFQDSLDWDFPIRESSYEKMKAKAMEAEYYEDENGNKVESKEYYYVGDKEVEVPVLTQADVDQVDALVKNSHYAMSYNMNVSNIISEEASAFFSGQKTAKEVCDIIQSRLSIYINENS